MLDLSASNSASLPTSPSVPKNARIGHLIFEMPGFGVLNPKKSLYLLILIGSYVDAQ